MLSVPPVRRPFRDPGRSVFGRRARANGTRPDGLGRHQRPLEAAHAERAPPEARARHRPPERHDAGLLQGQVQHGDVREADERLRVPARERGIEPGEQAGDAVAAARAEDRLDGGIAKRGLEVLQALPVGAGKVAALGHRRACRARPRARAARGASSRAAEERRSAGRRGGRDQRDPVTGGQAGREDQRDGRHGQNSSLQMMYAATIPDRSVIRLAASV